MSYILDALKKSQAAREGNDPARATDVYVQALGTLRRSRTMLWAGAGLMAVNVVGLIGWWVFSRTATPDQVAMATMPASSAASPSSVAAAATPASVPVPTSPEPAIVATATTVVPAVASELRPLPGLPVSVSPPAVTASVPEPEPLAEATDVRPPSMALTDASTDTATAIQRPAATWPAVQSNVTRNTTPTEAATAESRDGLRGSAAHASTPEDGTPWFIESTPALQQRFADLKLDVHVYSEQPQERFVFIKMTKYHEGDSTPTGLQVEQIVSDGVILSFEGTRFRFPAQ